MVAGVSAWLVERMAAPASRRVRLAGRVARWLVKQLLDRVLCALQACRSKHFAWATLAGEKRHVLVCQRCGRAIAFTEPA